MISVCIITNKIDDVLNETIASYIHVVDEICLGVNQINNPVDLDTLQQQFQNRLSIHQISWNGYGPTKNELNLLAKNDWILSVDSDEVADSNLQSSLKTFTNHTSQEVFEIRIQHYLGKQKIRFGAWGRGKTLFIRLFNRKVVQWNTATVHESLIIPKEIALKSISGSIKHYTVKDFSELLVKSNHYAQLSATKKLQSGKKTFWGKASFSALFSFIKEYFLYFGLLDGRFGLQIAYANALYNYKKYRMLWNANRRK